MAQTQSWQDEALKKASINWKKEEEKVEEKKGEKVGEKLESMMEHSRDAKSGGCLLHIAPTWLGCDLLHNTTFL